MTASINEREEKLRGIGRKPQAFCGRHGARDENAADEHFGALRIFCGSKSVVTDEQRRDFASAIVEEAKRLARAFRKAFDAGFYR